jgi:hypothetical protein
LAWIYWAHLVTGQVSRALYFQEVGKGTPDLSQKP